MNYFIFPALFFKSNESDQLKYVRKIRDRPSTGRLALDTKNLSSIHSNRILNIFFSFITATWFEEMLGKSSMWQLPLGTNVPVALAIVCEQKEWMMCLVCQFGAEFTGRKGQRGAAMVGRQSEEGSLSSPACNDNVYWFLWPRERECYCVKGRAFVGF